MRACVHVVIIVYRVRAQRTQNGARDRRHRSLWPTGVTANDGTDVDALKTTKPSLNKMRI